MAVNTMDPVPDWDHSRQRALGKSRGSKSCGKNEVLLLPAFLPGPEDFIFAQSISMT